MKTWSIGLMLMVVAWRVGAVEPYLMGDRLAPADLATEMSQVEHKLSAEGFTPIGRHLPKGVADRGTVIVTDPAFLASVRGASVVAAPLRVGVKSDGTVSYENPDYWLRALVRRQPEVIGAQVPALSDRLARALGHGKGFGGDVKADALPDYHYMMGMERFDSGRNELRTFGSFDDAVRTVRDNLAKGVANTAKVYEVVLPDRHIAVFGVAMNDPSDGEGWWVNKIGADQIAGLPYEIYVVDGKVQALYARYRIALGWPSLGMGTFMGIVNAPGRIQSMLTQVAGGAPGAN